MYEFQSAYECLKELYEAHNAAFESLYGDLDEDDYNDLADVELVDDQPFIDFENCFEHISYRAYMANLLELWENDSNANPLMNRKPTANYLP